MATAATLPPPGFEPYATRFFGRERELQALRARLSETRLVSLLGPPGIGKSRLAARLASLAGAAVRCDVSDAVDEAGVGGALALALGVASVEGGAPGPSIVDRLAVALSALGPLLVVLDGCEGAVSAAAATVGSWMRAAPEVRFLVTSRVRLGLEGETLFDLGALDLPDETSDPRASDAVELLFDRARAQRRELGDLDADDLQHAALLVRRLDGIPLAIELCAARLRVSSLSDLATRIERDADATVLGSRERPSVLRREIERSWGLLSALEREVFATSAVFRGGFDAEAMEAVWSSAELDTLDVLSSLRDQSLLTLREVEQRVRFSVLTSLRAFAEERLVEQGLAARAHERHAAHYAGLARATLEQLATRTGDKARARLLQDTENYLAAHLRSLTSTDPRAAEHALLTATALVSAGALPSVEAGLRLLDQAEALPGAGRVSLSLRARALQARAGLAIQVDQAAACLASANDLAMEAERVSDKEAEALALGTLGELHTVLGAFAEGHDCLTRAQALLKSSGAWALEARVLGAMGSNRLEAGKVPEARLLFAQALAIHRRGDPLAEAKGLNRLAVAELEEGRIEAARAHFEEGLALAKGLGDKRAEAMMTGNLAALLQDVGHLAEAQAGYERAIGLSQRLGSRHTEAVHRAFLSGCLFERGELDLALRGFEDALALSEREGLWKGLMLAPLGAVRASLGDIEGARAALEAAELELQRVGQELVLEAQKLYQGHLELAEARRAAAAGDLASEARWFQVAEQRARASLVRPRPGEGASGPALRAESTDARLALRTLRAALTAYREEREIRHASAREAAPLGLVVARDGAFFQPPRGPAVEDAALSETISLARRRALRLLFAALIDARWQSPGRPVSARALAEAGWPDDDLTPEQGADRVYVAIGTLRKLGLRDLIERRDDGYRLDPDVPIFFDEGRAEGT